MDGITESIGRLYSVHPAQVQLCALRLLLNHARGPTSFEDIRTVDGVLHDSFQDAAVALELVKEDTLWIECMREANDSQKNSFAKKIVCFDPSEVRSKQPQTILRKNSKILE